MNTLVDCSQQCGFPLKCTWKPLEGAGSVQIGVKGSGLGFAKTHLSAVWRVNLGLEQARRQQGWSEGHCGSPVGGDGHRDKGKR